MVALSKNGNKLALIIVLVGSSLRIAAATDAVVILSLKDAITRAISEDHRIKKAKNDLRAAQAGTDTIREGFLPSVRLDATAGTLHDREPNVGELSSATSDAGSSSQRVARDRNKYEGKVILEQPLFTGFKDIHNYRARHAAETEAEYALKSTGLLVTNEVIENYFGVQLAQRNLSAEQEVAKVRAAELRDVLNRASAGRATALDRLEAEYASKSQTPELLSLSQELERKTLKLARLLGLPLDQEIKLSDDLELTSVLFEGAKVPDFKEAYTGAMRENPELRRAEATELKIQWEQARDGSKHLPTIDLELTAGTAASKRTDIGTRDALTYSGLIHFQMPLFTGLSSFAERRVNAEKLAAAREDQTVAREKVLDDLAEAYRVESLATSRVAAGRANVEFTGESVESTRNLYNVGRATLTDVLKAYSRQVDAKKGLSQALYDRMIALATIKTLTTQ